MAPAGSEMQWYVIHTKPKQERRAEENLRAWGIDTLAPQLRERHYTARHPNGYRVSPLFPRYLFARFTAAECLAKVRLTRGVHDIVSFGGVVTPVGDDLIALVRERIETDGFVRVAEPVAGDLVRVVAGPLRALVGVFERDMRAQDRVMVLLTTLGSQTRVQLPRAYIQKLPLSSIA